MFDSIQVRNDNLDACIAKFLELYKDFHNRSRMEFDPEVSLEGRAAFSERLQKEVNEYIMF